MKSTVKEYSRICSISRSLFKRKEFCDLDKNMLILWTKGQIFLKYYTFHWSTCSDLWRESGKEKWVIPLYIFMEAHSLVTSLSVPQTGQKLWSGDQLWIQVAIINQLYEQRKYYSKCINKTGIYTMTKSIWTPEHNTYTFLLNIQFQI